MKKAKIPRWDTKIVQTSKSIEYHTHVATAILIIISVNTNMQAVSYPGF